MDVAAFFTRTRDYFMATTFRAMEILAILPPALIVLIVAILFELVAWVGFSSISNALFSARQAIFNRGLNAKKRNLRCVINGLRTDIKKTSAMDNFAKWARVNRQIDAKQAEYDKISSTSSETRTIFLFKSHVITRIIYYAGYAIVIYTYRYRPMFYIPDDWFGFFGPLLSLPYAPARSVSIFWWMLVCRRVARSAIGAISSETPIELGNPSTSFVAAGGLFEPNLAMMSSILQ